MPQAPKLSKRPPTVEQYLASFPAPVASMAQRLRRIITRAVPDVIERVYPGWKLIGYRAIAGRDSSYFCFVAPATDRVVLGFEHGRLLSDPEGLLEGDGTQVRHLVMRRRGEIQEEKLVPLILEAAMIATERKGL